jgi:hypothetical protein
VLRLELASALRRDGLAWSPARGDRFVVPDRGMDDEVFVVSDLTIEVREVPSGLVLGFNGTTEWALDSLKTDQVLWLPREDQLRELLGPRFRRLEATDAGWRVVVAEGLQERSFEDPDVESAYALAALRSSPVRAVPDP